MSRTFIVAPEALARLQPYAVYNRWAAFMTSHLPCFPIIYQQACNNKPALFCGRFVRRGIDAGDGHAAIAPERPGRDLDARRRLAALVLRPIHHLHNTLD